MIQPRRLALLLALSLGPAPAPPQPPAGPALVRVGGEGFAHALRLAESALERGDLEAARDQIRRAQERDPNATSAWALRARWAAAVGDVDEEVYALHRQLALAEAQDHPRREVEALRERLLALDPLAATSFGLRQRFVDQLDDLAKDYEKDGRRHSAIRVHKQVLALDPENAGARAAIERIASAPDPSLAEDAKPRDLLEGISAEWIAEHDTKHLEWDERAKLERENYVTHTNAGYEVLVRAGEAMEQMNAFYRQFFRFGTEEHGGSVPRIALHIFKTRDEYLELGIGPPVEWSGGHFTGNAVETYVGSGGFEEMTGTLFHEAAHQFVSLATSSAGWLNEGLASFFEGCRILANGTVLMNLPANHRLFPLAARMERGWMSSAQDGIDPEEPSESTPEKAPTFRIVLENEYAWGPPWYAPTWGVVYFLYNYQDPWDGRFVYRHAFQEFIDKSGGRMGEGAVENFEEVVLANPAPPTKGVERPADLPAVALPETVEQLDVVWKDYMLRLRDEQSGRVEADRPYLRWGDLARLRGDLLDAKEHYEKGIVAAPDDADVHQHFAELLAEDLGDTDRAVKLYLRTAQLLEAEEEVDGARLADVERAINKLDSRQRTLARVREQIDEAARDLVGNYQAAGRHMMAMDVAWRLGNDLQLPELFEEFEESVRASGKSLAMWRLAYDEESLEGWSDLGVEDPVFTAEGSVLKGEFGRRVEGNFDYRLMTLDVVTSGDYSLEAEVRAERDDVSFAGLVFGRKTPTDFHAFALFPPGKDDKGNQRTGFVDLVSFYGDSTFDTWRHEPVPADQGSGSAAERWYRLRVDVIGNAVDVWLDGEYVTTQEFSNVDVLRGNFGLLIGTGEASFRNVRYLARVARDPGAAIERAVRLEDLKRPGEAVNGSWLGQVPPFPEVARWAQGERNGWEDARNRPQLLTLFSIQQNDLIRLDPWLRWLAEEYADVGLEFVSVALRHDGARLDAYLEQHPFPGAVGVDKAGTDSLGATFGTFAIARFNLPRIVLIDVDGTVAWEGDPGFARDTAFDPSQPSYLRGPLNDLVARRQLKEVDAWLRRWLPGGPAALERGDLATVAPLLREAQELSGSRHDEVVRAAGAVRAAEAAVLDLEGTVTRLVAAGAEPALDPLLAWAEALEIEPPRGAGRVLRDARKADAYKDWGRLEKILGRYEPADFREAEGEALAALRQGLLDDLARLQGELVRTLEADVQATEDAETLADLVEAAAVAPARWLAAQLLGI